MDDKLVDLRNELIVQGVNVYLLARRAAMVAIGTAVVAMQEAQQFADHAAEQGEIVTEDVGHQYDAVKQRILTSAEDANRMREELTAGATAALMHSLEAIRDSLPVPLPAPRNPGPPPEQLS
jgi:hypothetical protein